jgi:hypothetical protein
MSSPLFNNQAEVVNYLGSKSFKCDRTREIWWRSPGACVIDLKNLTAVQHTATADVLLKFKTLKGLVKYVELTTRSA